MKTLVWNVGAASLVGLVVGVGHGLFKQQLLAQYLAARRERRRRRRLARNDQVSTVLAILSDRRTQYEKVNLGIRYPRFG